jgi:hypothetical protein
VRVSGHPRELWFGLLKRNIDLPWHLLKRKCALGPFLSILVIECQHKCLSENICQMLDKVQIKSKGMFLRLSTLF